MTTIYYKLLARYLGNKCQIYHLIRLLEEMVLSRLLLVDPWMCCDHVGLLQPLVYQYENNSSMLQFVIIPLLTFYNMENFRDTMAEQQM